MIAHISKDGAREESCVQHCEEVSKLCGAYAGEVGLRATGELIGILHDGGKFTQGFEKYIRYAVAHPEEHHKGPDHSTMGMKLAITLAKPEDGGQMRFAAELAAAVIGGHHGGLGDLLDPCGRSPFAERLEKAQERNYDEACRNYFASCRTKEQLRGLLEQSAKELYAFAVKMQKADLRMCFSYGLLVKYLFSCLIDADRYATACFMQGRPCVYQERPRTDWDVYISKMEEYLKTLSGGRKPNASGSEMLNKLRQEISDHCKQAADCAGGIYQLSCPTGSGKTLASFRFALHHAQKWGKRRIFYIIPYITILDQTERAIKNAVGTELADEILPLHSAVVYDGADEEHKLLTERMDAPVVLTTMVRFLDTFFAGGTQNLRPIHHFTDAVILFDEVQTLPVNCVNLFNCLLEFLTHACGATVVLCTATQPLLDRVEKPALPVRLTVPAELSGCGEDAFALFRRVNIEPACIKGGYTEQQLAQRIADAAQENGSALAVMNTKSAARVLYDEVKKLCGDEFSVYYLSTSLCPAHRKRLLEEINQKLPGKVIVVSTQLIEAGVDVSFHCAFRSLAGLDSIIQTAGRCNRHSETDRRPVYIVNPCFENLGTLEDIRRGRDCTQRILGWCEKQPERYGGDLLSPSAMEEYYRLYFYEQKEQMVYRMPKLNKSMMELLTENGCSAAEYQNVTARPFPYPLRQSFATAGKAFCAIDQNTISVIVPYQEGKQIIAALGGEQKSLGETKKLLRKAQEYSVNLYENGLRRLGNAVRPLKEAGAFALAEGYYSECFGVTGQITGSCEIL